MASRREYQRAWVNANREKKREYGRRAAKKQRLKIMSDPVLVATQNTERK